MRVAIRIISKVFICHKCVYKEQTENVLNPVVTLDKSLFVSVRSWDKNVPCLSTQIQPSPVPLSVSRCLTDWECFLWTCPLSLVGTFHWINKKKRKNTNTCCIYCHWARTYTFVHRQISLHDKPQDECLSSALDVNQSHKHPRWTKRKKESKKAQRAKVRLWKYDTWPGARERCIRATHLRRFPDTGAEWEVVEDRTGENTQRTSLPAHFQIMQQTHFDTHVSISGTLKWN